MLPQSQVSAVRHPERTRATPAAIRNTIKDTSNSDPIGLMGTTMTYPREVEVYGEGEPAEYLYKVIAGVVRTYTVLSDGRRQVGGFYLPGDFFGLEFGEEHAFSAETVTDANVLVIKRSSLIALSVRDAELAHQLFALTGRELKRMQDHVVLLIKSAQERVVTFLLEMADRISGGNVIELPMLRQDIADYLGLTVETVSRTLALLEASAAIKLSTSRRIVLRNRVALMSLNGSNERPATAAGASGH
jgi:CRP-like cAMP-binding protein